MRAARIAVLVSNAYSPAIAAIALDFFNRKGFDVVHELILPNYKVYRWAIGALAAQAPPVRDVV